MGLLVNQYIQGHVFLVYGKEPLATKRRLLVEKHGATAVSLSAAPSLEDLKTRGRPEVDGIVDGVFLIPHPEETANLAQVVADCRRLRIPVNVAEDASLCTFALPSIFEDEPFQLAITTNGMGCRLANRIKRAVQAALPQNMAAICNNVGSIRNQLKLDVEANGDYLDDAGQDDDVEQSSKLNKLVLGVEKGEKLRWLSQMVEYYPLEKLASVTVEDLMNSPVNAPEPVEQNSKGRISLVGAGPGSIELLTTEALQEINTADYVLADKLVPAQVLALIPRETPTFIARKFPGNAERAQEELLEKGLAALNNGLHVVRLKQGDPYIYGRGAEEFLFFSKHGYKPKVIAGVTSALAAPLLAKIPPTHRGAADQILIMTGTGRAGALPDPPQWKPSQTTIFLMALHRIRDVTQILIDAGWDPTVACTSIERASCPDQRVVRARLSTIADALDAVGSRPPGLLVVGRACEVMVEHPAVDAAVKWVVEES